MTGRLNCVRHLAADAPERVVLEGLLERLRAAIGLASPYAVTIARDESDPPRHPEGRPWFARIEDGDGSPNDPPLRSYDGWRATALEAAQLVWDGIRQSAESEALRAKASAEEALRDAEEAAAHAARLRDIPWPTRPEAVAS